MTSDPEGAGGDARRLIYNSRGPVWLEAGGETVLKQYDYGDLENSIQQARHEFERLEGFEAALRPIDGVRCPRPFELIEPADGSLPAVRMEWCPGEELFYFLSRPDVSTELVESIAERMAAAITTYTETFDEPYVDCSFHNALYDVQSDTLTLIDFGPWRATPRPGPHIGALERSLGSVVGMAVRTQLGLTLSRSLRERRRLIRAAASVVTAADDRRRPDGINRSHMRLRAWRSYRRYTYQGSPLRQLWYRTGGAALVWLILHNYRRLAV